MTINGVELHVEPPVGEGEPLVLVHGGWTDHTAFAALIPPLSQSFRVVRYDRRGHSRSERGPAPALRRTDEDDLAALIMELGGGPAHLVGTSYGAAISLALAGRRPELVRSVIAHEPPLLGLVPMPAVEAGFRGVQDQLASGDVAGGTRRFFEEIVLGPGAWEKIPEPIRHVAIGNAQTFLDLREIPDWDGLDVAAVSRFPRRIVITRGDTSPGWLSHVALAVAKLIGRESRVIAGAGHSPHLTHPHDFAALIHELIGGQAGRGQMSRSAISSRFPAGSLK
jgi:pimeloyl-ACP methyl ester carboxylesterase